MATTIGATTVGTGGDWSHQLLGDVYKATTAILR